MSPLLPPIPFIHRLSCTFGVGRLRSVKFALVRTRQKGGGACELSSAELPFIRPYASLVNISRDLAAVRAFPTGRCVCIVARDDNRALFGHVRTIDAFFLRRVSHRLIGIAQDAPIKFFRSIYRSPVLIIFFV